MEACHKMENIKPKVYIIEDIPMIHISEFCRLEGRSIQSARYLIEKGNSIRKLKYFRDRSRLMIPIIEIEGYPYTNRGYLSSESEVYHYRKNESGIYERFLCKECSYGSPCQKRIAADALIVPEGDL